MISKEHDLNINKERIPDLANLETRKLYCRKLAAAGGWISGNKNIFAHKNIFVYLFIPY